VQKAESVEAQTKYPVAPDSVFQVRSTLHVLPVEAPSAGSLNVGPTISVSSYFQIVLSVVFFTHSMLEEPGVIQISLLALSSTQSLVIGSK